MTAQPHLRVVADGQAPPPMLPPDIDLTDLPEVMLNIQWLCDSRYAFLATPEEFGAAVRLHAKSMHERPAATLPSDDAELTFLAGYGRDVAAFRRVKDRALEGWTLCNDGRFYRRDMAVKALDAWIKRIAQRRKSAAGVAKRKKVEFNPEPYDRPLKIAIDALYGLEPHAPVLRNYLNVQPEIEPDEPQALTSGSTSGQTPGTTKGREAKQSESEGYISPTAAAVGVSRPMGDSGTGSMPSEPAGTTGRVKIPPWAPHLFEDLWEGYDYKRDKTAAREAFDKLAPQPPITFANLMGAVMRYRQFKPPSNDTAYLATWLNRRRWEDEYPALPLPKPGPRGSGGGRPGGKPFQPTSMRGR